MKTFDMDKIARGLGAERRGRVTVRGGYFGAMQLLADIEARFRVPSGGGRPTDPGWTERRLLPLAPKTLKKLEEMSAKAREQGMTWSRCNDREDRRAAHRRGGRGPRATQAARKPLTNTRGGSTCTPAWS
jgi:hypothetical protein